MTTESSCDGCGGATTRTRRSVETCASRRRQRVSALFESPSVAVISAHGRPTPRASAT
ncbi:MAG: hypothetical protein OZ948_09190 [Deltaproteobacteria bacterium]|nr:hypothetical protein [Deltaproteobacteria bacterium]